MRAGIVVSVTPEDRRRLEAIVGNRNSPQKHAARAQALIATADGCGTNEVMRRSGRSKPAVWRWQERFIHGRRGRWAPARQDPQARQGAAARPDRRPGGEADLGRSAGRDDALDHARHGQALWRRRGQRPAHLEGPWPDAAPDAHLQAVEGRQVRREVHRRSRPLRRSAGARGRALDGREEPDPGARPPPTWAAPQEGAGGDHDPTTSATAQPPCSPRSMCSMDR